MSKSPSNHESISLTGVMFKIWHHFGDWEMETKHMTRIEKSIYFDMRTLYLNQGQPLTDDLTLLQRRLSCISDDEKQALDFVLLDKFKHCKKSKSYKHKEWDLLLKNYRWKHRNVGNAPSNASNERGNAQVTDGNNDSNASNEFGNGMSNAERQALFKQKRLEMIQALRNIGLEVANNVKMAELKPLYEQYFNDMSNNVSNATGNENGNTSNAQVTDGNDEVTADNEKNHANNQEPLTNNHKPVTNNQEIIITTTFTPQPSVIAGYAMYHSDDTSKYNLIALEKKYVDACVDFIMQAKASYPQITLSDNEYQAMFDNMRRWSLESNNNQRTPQKWMNTWLEWVKNNAYRANIKPSSTKPSNTASLNVNDAWDKQPQSQPVVMTDELMRMREQLEQAIANGEI